MISRRRMVKIFKPSYRSGWRNSPIIRSLCWLTRSHIFDWCRLYSTLRSNIFDSTAWSKRRIICKMPSPRMSRLQRPTVSEYLFRQQTLSFVHFDCFGGVLLEEREVYWGFELVEQSWESPDLVWICRPEDGQQYQNPDFVGESQGLSKAWRCIEKDPAGCWKG